MLSKKHTNYRITSITDDDSHIFKESSQHGLSWWIVSLTVLVIAGSVILGVYYLLNKKKNIFSLSRLHKFVEEHGSTYKSIIHPTENLPEDQELKKSIQLYKDGYLQVAKANFYDILEMNKANEIKSLAALYLGILFDEEGKFDMAVSFFNRSIKFDQKSFYAYYNKSIALRHIGKHDEAIEVLQQAQKLRPDFIDPKILQGKWEYDANLPQKAEKTLKAVLKVKDSALAAYNLGRVYKSQSKRDEAIASFKKAMEMSHDGTIMYRSANELGIIYATQDNQDLKQAKYYFSKAADTAKNQPKYYYNLALVEYNLGQFILAVEHLNRSIQLGRNSPTSYLYIANLYKDMKYYHKAELALKKGLVDMPGSTDLLSLLSEVYIIQGKWNMAIKNLQQLLSLSTKSLEKSHTLYTLGIVYIEIQDFRKAITYLDRALNIDPSNIDTLLAIGKAHRLNGEMHKAIAIYKSSLSNSPDNFDLLEALSQTYTDLDMFHEAEALLEKIVKHSSVESIKLAMAYYQLGLLKKQKQDYQNALYSFEKALHTKGLGTDLLYQLWINTADTILLSGKPAKLTYPHLQKSISLHPDRYEARFLLARALILENTATSKEKAMEELNGIILGENIDPMLSSRVYTLRGILFFRYSQYGKALEDFNQALNIDPSNQEAFENKRVVSEQLTFSR